MLLTGLFQARKGITAFSPEFTASTRLVMKYSLESRFSEKVILQNYDANNDALLMLLNDNNPAGNGLGSHATYVSGSLGLENWFSAILSVPEIMLMTWTTEI